MAAATFVDDSGPTAKRVRLCSKTPPAFVPIFGELGCEDKAARQQVYLARVLPGTRASSGYKDVAKLTRAELLNMVRDAFDNPVAGASGKRPRASTDSPIDFILVARKLHAGGSAHRMFRPKGWHEIRSRPVRRGRSTGAHASQS